MTHILDHGAELVKSLTDAELSAAINSARLACRAAWAAWELVRDAGETNLWCAEFQAHNAAQRLLGRLLGEDYQRDIARKIARFSPAPMSGREDCEAWINGPGSDA